MDEEIKKQIVEFLKENLKISIDCDQDNYGGSVTVSVDLYLNQEKIDTATGYFSLNN